MAIPKMLSCSWALVCSAFVCLLATSTMAAATAQQRRVDWATEPAVPPNNNPATESFGQYQQQYSKRYPNQDQTNQRENIYQNNLDIINTNNNLFDQGKVPYQLGVNNLTDLTPTEYQAMRGFKPPKAQSTSTATTTTSGPPPINYTTDWGVAGYVTGVKNQGACGSCWAFAATGVIEGQYFNKTGNLVSLSEQNLVDCSSISPYNNGGCNGGVTKNALAYVQANGIESTAAYPYVSPSSSSCSFSFSQSVTSISGCAYTQYGNEAALQNVLAKVGPVAVAISAGLPSFQLYKSGVYNDTNCNSTGIDHAVLVTGAGWYNGISCYVVKNSWGTSWGINGYMYMARGYNRCGIAMWPVYAWI